MDTLDSLQFYYKCETEATRTTVLLWPLLAIVASCLSDVTLLSCLTTLLELSAARLINWVKDTYPSRGYQSELLPEVEACTRTFQDNERYKSDSRYFRVWKS
uniref:BUB1 N-terminal domain-containing protein n=1 Tax=Physcomitrium patens TaxID=3218 RepID=A0A7I4BBF0_PHYPA